MSRDYPSDWNLRRKQIYNRDDFTCQNCGAAGGPQGDSELHAHHIVPKSRGGTHDASNLISLCKGCHNAVHSNSKRAPTMELQSTNYDTTQINYQMKNRNKFDIEYHNISELIFERTHSLLSDGLNFIKVTFEEDTITLDKLAEELATSSVEFRQTTFEITTTISQLEGASTEQYPINYIQTNEDMIEAAEKAITWVLEFFEKADKKVEEILNTLSECPNCKNTTRKYDDFCGNCGTEIVLFAYCSNCQERISHEDQFCRGCGELVSDIQNNIKNNTRSLNDLESLISNETDIFMDIIDDFVEKSTERDKILQTM